MYRDYKSGLVAGIAVAGVATVWLATRPSLSTQARIRRSTVPAASFANQFDEMAGAAPSPRQIDTPDQETPIDRREPYPTPQAAGPDLTIYEKPTKIETQRFHIVGRGETLSAVSQRYYGSPNRWRKIFEANQDKIKDPDRITPGTKLIIPEY